MWSTHTMEYYSVIKRNEGLIYATTWVDPENTMLSDISQTQQDSIVRFHEVPRISKFTGTESRIEVAREWGWERS